MQFLFLKLFSYREGDILLFRISQFDFRQAFSVPEMIRLTTIPLQEWHFIHVNTVLDNVCHQLLNLIHSGTPVPNYSIQSADIPNTTSHYESMEMNKLFKFE